MNLSIPNRAHASGAPLPSFLFGCLVALVAAVDLSRAVRPDLLADSDPTWAFPRLALSLFVLSISTWAGGLAAAGFFQWSRTAASTRPAEGLVLSPRALCVIGAAALAFGITVRFAWLDRIPATLWYDEILPLAPSLALKVAPSDFADAIRAIPEHQKSDTVTGVLYLEAYRAVLGVFGTTLFGVRFASAFASALSLVTAMLLARVLLPRGGAVVTGLVLAGLRWQLILARYGWNVLALTPLVDLATLCLIIARRRFALGAALAGGLIAGVGVHVYLGAWIAGAALTVFLLWPGTSTEIRFQQRAALTAVFGLGFLLAASPIVFLKEGRESNYFARGRDQSLRRDMRLLKSWITPPLQIVADSLKAPWFLPDPVLRHDLQKSRLGWIIGLPVAMAFLLALRRPRDELSALIFAHAGIGVAASLRWGFPGHPNGYRFAYLTTLTAVAAAAGVLWLLSLVPTHLRRPATLLALGLLSVSAVLGARDALFRWGESRETFREYRGESTLIGRAALRWQNFGSVRLDAALKHSPLVVQWVRDYRLDPEDQRNRTMFSAPARRPADDRRCFRISPTGPPDRQERRVERIQDGWGNVHGDVVATRCPDF